MKRIRLRLGVSQDEVAAGIGCTRMNVSYYERGQTIPPDAARRLIAFAATKGLNIDFNHIYGTAELPMLRREAQTA
jgi:transcriptional regulator with XRE-family HTH domain